MRKFLTALLLVLASVSAHAASDLLLPLDECKEQATYGFPVTRKVGVTPLCRPGYLNLFDTRAGIPIVVSYVLKPENATGCLPRESFRADPDVGGKPTTRDYAKSGKDIGHNANAADLAYNERVAKAARLITNMSPQDPSFNRGIWKKLEDGTRGWALSRGNPIQIYVANVFDRKQDPMIGENMVTVPPRLIKILVDTKTNEVLVFSFKNEGSKANLGSFITSLAEAQKQAGVQFPMPENAVFSKTLWKVDMKSARAVKADVCSTK